MSKYIRITDLGSYGITLPTNWSLRVDVMAYASMTSDRLQSTIDFSSTATNLFSQNELSVRSQFWLITAASLGNNSGMNRYSIAARKVVLKRLGWNVDLENGLLIATRPLHLDETYLSYVEHRGCLDGMSTILIHSKKLDNRTVRDEGLAEMLTEWGGNYAPSIGIGLDNFVMITQSTCLWIDWADSPEMLVIVRPKVEKGNGDAAS